MSDFLQLLDDPHARHAMLVHAPIALCALGVLPVLALALTRFRCAPLKWFCIGWFVIASIGASLAAGAGEEAEENVEHGATPLTTSAEAALESHEELGENGWIWPLIPAGLVALTLVPARKAKGEGAKPKRRLQVAAGSAAIVASIGVGVWVSLTAHQGGTLVYVHGVGVPQQTGLQPGATLRGDAPRPGGDHDHDDD